MSSNEIATDMGLTVEVETASEGDSLASGSGHSRTRQPNEPVRFSDLVLLGRQGCRVIMTQRGAKRVCGRSRATCTRKNHFGMGDERRAEPAYYVAYFTKDGEVDGLLDQKWSREDAYALRDQEMEDHAMRLGDLLQEADTREAATGQPKATGLEPSPPPEEPARAAGPPQEPPRTPEGTRPVQDREATPAPEGPALLPPEARPGRKDPATIYYGLENPQTGDREVSSSLEEAQALRNVGWEARRTFRNWGEAVGWKEGAVLLPFCHPCGKRHPAPVCRPRQRIQNPPAGGSRRVAPPEPPIRPPVPALTDPSPRDGGNGGPTLYGMEKPEDGNRLLAESREEVSVLTDTGYALRKLFRDRQEGLQWTTGIDLEGVARTAHVTKIGPDPSTGDSELFGVNMNLIGDMDKMLLPGGSTPGEADDLYDCAADVMALPGGYRGTTGHEDDEDGDVAKALMTIAAGRRDTALHMRYRARSQNGLLQLKGQEDLVEFVENVHDGWKCAHATMHSQFTKKLHQAGYSRDAIESYLQQGVLPRVIMDTYNGYTYFLTTLAGYASKVTSGEVWKDSVAGNLLRLHSRELSLIRSTSASYRELLLRNYTHIRNHRKTSFWNDKLSKRMALVMTQVVHQQGQGKSTGGSAPQTSRNYCETCKRVHQGRPCAAAPLSMANRTKLGANLPQRKYEKALRHVKEAFAADANAAHDGVIEAARAAALSAS